MRSFTLGLAVALGCATPVVSFAADPDPAAVQAPIKGASVMGDKGRSGPDGWAWAPVTRDQSPTGKAAGETQASVQAAPNAKPASGASPTLPPGQDPGTPATPTSGPGVSDSVTSSTRP